MVSLADPMRVANAVIEQLAADEVLHAERIESLEQDAKVLRELVHLGLAQTATLHSENLRLRRQNEDLRERLKTATAYLRERLAA